MNPLTFLQQPYPARESPKRVFWRSLLISLFVGTFLLLFQPFGLDDWQTPYKAVKILGFGLVTFGVLLLDSVLLPRLLPQAFAEANWTVGKEIVTVGGHIVLIAVANRLYLGWLLGLPPSYGWGVMLTMTLLVGLFPVVGTVVANYIIQLRRYTRRADSLSAQMTHAEPIAAAAEPELAVSMGSQPLTLLAENEKDSLTLNASDWLAIESSDNYCTVFYQKAGQLRKELMRSSLSRLEKQLSPQLAASGLPAPVRCHRSWVVSLAQVERVSGNAQGYKLHLAEGQVVVPVARQYNDTLVASLRNG